MTETPDSVPCARCATYQHDASYHEENPDSLPCVIIDGQAVPFDETPMPDAANPDSLVAFVAAKPGDGAVVYCGDYVRDNTDYGWVTDLEYFDDRWGEVKLTRQVWRLISEDEFVLPDPHPADEDDSIRPVSEGTQ